MTIYVRFLTSLLVGMLLFGGIPIHGQALGDTQPEDNWLRSFGFYRDPYMYFDYSKYTKEDVGRVKEKLTQMHEAGPGKEWEGTFYFGPEETVGFSVFQINFEKGFVQLYIYTCLPEFRAFSFGQVLNTPEYIEITPDFHSAPSAKMATRYIKVRWGAQLYLVEESSILAFSEQAAGRFVAADDGHDNYSWRSFWVQGPIEDPLQGTPQLPLSYKKFERLPITGKVLSVGKRTLVRESGDEYSYRADFASYTITVSAGTAKGLKKGMIFELPNTGEIITITRTFKNTAAGTVTRYLNESGKDNCHDDKNNPITCPAILPGMKIQTRIGNFNL